MEEEEEDNTPIASTTDDEDETPGMGDLPWEKKEEKAPEKKEG